MDHATLAALRDRHPAWRMLASTHAPLAASFLHWVFAMANVRVARRILPSRLEQERIGFGWLGDQLVRMSPHVL